eukprot:364212-Chlamydomonas_euryale.AAC.11
MRGVEPLPAHMPYTSRARQHESACWQVSALNCSRARARPAPPSGWWPGHHAYVVIARQSTRRYSPVRRARPAPPSGWWPCRRAQCRALRGHPRAGHPGW